MNRLQFDPYLARWIDYWTSDAPNKQADEDLCWALLFALRTTNLVNQEYIPFIEQYKLGKTNLNEFKWDGLNDGTE